MRHGFRVSGFGIQGSWFGIRVACAARLCRSPVPLACAARLCLCLCLCLCRSPVPLACAASLCLCRSPVPCGHEKTPARCGHEKARLSFEKRA
jgi:hypothetical protein